MIINLDSTPHSENDLLMEKTVDEICNNDEHDKVHKRKHRRRRRILYNLFDFLAIVASKNDFYLKDFLDIFVLFLIACVIFGLIYVFIPPVQRGFFCDDISIQYPFRADTIPMWLLAIYGGVVPIVIVRKSSLYQWIEKFYFFYSFASLNFGLYVRLVVPAMEILCDNV